MKQRFISGMAALCLLAVALFLFDTIAFNLIISTVCVLGVYEFLMATKLSENKPLLIICLAFTSVIPFITDPFVRDVFPIILYAFFILLFCILLAEHNTIRFENIAFGFFASFFMSCSLTTGAMMRSDYGPVIGLLYVCIGLGGAWFSDTGAYFVGVFFGKHKLAPEISPKKTIEGAIGGILTSEIFLLLLSYAFTFYGESVGVPFKINYFLLIILAPVISVLGILGDLSASIIKRQCGIKDFGSIMPGHGGVLDRFDSVLFVMPAVYIISRYMPLYTLI